MGYSAFQLQLSASNVAQALSCQELSSSMGFSVACESASVQFTVDKCPPQSQHACQRSAETLGAEEPRRLEAGQGGRAAGASAAPAPCPAGAHSPGPGGFREVHCNRSEAEVTARACARAVFPGLAGSWILVVAH